MKVFALGIGNGKAIWLLGKLKVNGSIKNIRLWFWGLSGWFPLASSARNVEKLTLFQKRTRWPMNWSTADTHDWIRIVDKKDYVSTAFNSSLSLEVGSWMPHIFDNGDQIFTRILLSFSIRCCLRPQCLWSSPTKNGRKRTVRNHWYSNVLEGLVTPKTSSGRCSLCRWLAVLFFSWWRVVGGGNF